MLLLKDEAEIYRIGLIIGYFKKKDIINWADKVIETKENIEYEIIEVSLLENSSKADIVSKLREVKGILNEQLIINVLLGLLSYGYNSNKLSADEICTLLYHLVSNKIDISISNDIEQNIHYFSDGYYLATEGIYGDLKEICKELKEFLDLYTEYAEEFSLKICY